jgi:hypothetical protein
LVALALTCRIQAASLYVPNGSFESPATVFVDTRIDSWQKAAKPPWYDETAHGPWDQLMGLFLNTPPGDPSHIDNCDGAQAAYLFALPQVAIFQDYSSLDWSNSSPTHAFNAVFETGKSYRLAVGVIGGGGGMTNGATLQLSLYYRDDGGNMVTVASSSITNDPAIFSNTTHLVDFEVNVPPVQPGDAWAGRNIGVQLLSTVGFDMAGGYWDVDNVRLSSIIKAPDGSFESPVTPFVDTRIDGWQKAPKPAWFDESVNGPWDNLMGLFLNTPPSDPRHIDNCDGNQAAYLFASPQVAIFQDYDSTDWSHPAPTHAFNVTFQPGKSYTLTVGVIGGGGGMTNGATMQLSLYYRDSASNFVTVAATTITNTPANFPTTTHLVDYQVQVPGVRPTDAWAGQHIGVQLLSTVGFDAAGGYWDVDNVRLAEMVAPAFGTTGSSNGQFSFNVLSEPGVKFEIIASSALGAPLSGWTSLGTFTNTTGSSRFTDTSAAASARFYQARQLP